jgi:phytoene synthase
MTQPDPLADMLNLAQRLALSYAPARGRAGVLGLLALDNRLATILRAGGEPVMAQIKLAWWRDRLRENPQAWSAGEPLLQALRHWPADPAQLVPLVDGWEALLAEDLTMAAIEEFAQGRAAAWAALAGQGHQAAVQAAARSWALADLALNLGKGDEAAAARRLALASKAAPTRLPRRVRPLAVLAALTRRALIRDSGDLLDGPMAGLIALRIGLFGR